MIGNEQRRLKINLELFASIAEYKVIYIRSPQALSRQCSSLLISMREFHCSEDWTFSSSSVMSLTFMLPYGEQGDEERMLGLELSALCDRHSTGIASSQKNFIGFIVKPLFKSWVSFLDCPAAELCSMNIEVRALGRVNVTSWRGCTLKALYCRQF